VVYHLLDTYGLAAALQYLEKSVEGAGRKYGEPEEKYLLSAIERRKLKSGRTPLSLDEIAASSDLNSRLSSARMYADRLGARTDSPPIFINGIAIPKSQEWLPMMSQRVGLDVRTVQNAVFETLVSDDDWLPSMFLNDASFRRNPQVVPEDDKTVRHINVGDLPLEKLPSLPASEDPAQHELVHLTVAADLESKHGFELLMEALLYQSEHAGVEVAILHVPS